MQKQDKGDAFANLLNTLAANGVKIDTADSTSSSVNDVSDNTTDAAADDTCESKALDVSKNSEFINSSDHALSIPEEAASVEKDDSIEDTDKDFADINDCIEADDTRYKRYIEGESDELDTLKVRNYDKKEEVETHTKGLEVDTSKDIIEDLPNAKSTSIPDTPSNDKQMTAYASISTAKRKSPPKSSSTTTQSIPLKSSQVDSKTSLLTKGMSYFGRSTMTTTPKQSSVRYNNTNSDTQSVMSEISTDVKSTLSSAAKAKQEKEDIILKQHLKESGLILLKRLIEFLSECPPTIDEGSLVSEWRRKKESKSPTTHQKNKKKRARGLTLPASAIGWLSSQLLDDIDDTDILDDVPRQQLDCVHMLLRRVSSLRISGEVWPPPHPSTIKGKSKKNLDEGKKSLTTNLLSKLAIDTGSIDDESSCGTGGPSTVHDVISPPTLSKFQYYHHELQYNPHVNMIFFPNVSKLVINGIPPNWISNLDTCNRLDVFQLERGCILDVNMLFFPGDVIPTVDTSLHEDNIPRNLSLIDEDMEKKVEATIEHQTDDDHKDDIKQQPILTATPFEYKSISKLKLSNCAMGETAGLRGIKRRRRSNNVPRIPPLARFPNLTSLNLSNNELFKSKTVFAGLSALPLLSSIDLSYNRLSRYVCFCFVCCC